MSNIHKLMLFDFGYELKHDALEAHQERDLAPESSEERAFKNGRLLAYYEIISKMQGKARAFGIPLEEMRLDDIKPDIDLV